MPYQTRTIFGTGPVQYDDNDRARQASSMQANDSAVRMALAQMASADSRYGIDAQTGMQRYGIDAQRGMFGDELADRKAGREFQGGLARDLDASATSRAFGLADRQGASALAVTREGNAPAMAQIAHAGRAYDDQAPMRALHQEIARHGFAREQRSHRVDDYLDDQVLGALGGSASEPTTAAPSTTPGQVPGVVSHQASGSPLKSPGDVKGATHGGVSALGEDAVRAMLFKRMGMADPQDAAQAQQMALATKLLESKQPAARAMGAQILAQNKAFKGINGLDPKMLGRALGPQVDASTAIQGSPAMQRDLAGATETLARGGGSFSPMDALDEGVPQVDALVQKLVDEGVPQPEAMAAVKQHLEQNLPGFTWGRHPISKALSLLPGVDLYDTSSEGKVRNVLGLRR